ncbi:CCHC-type domain-containing protein [Trichonephila clavipes]|nr:CCHC-type domain-containing protein [Trichonephila clavipes]
MAFLGKGEKQDILQLAEELGVNATLNMTVPSIKIAITNSEVYEEEFVKNLVNDESNDSTNACSETSNLNFKKLIPDFDPKQSDINLYLVIFERQAKRASIEKKEWVGQLFGLLPLEIVQPEEQAENYDYVKKLLLKRFKLSPEVFRQKFVQHQKKSDSTWKDFTFEITNYLDEWLIGLEINTFQDLKDLTVVDQLKKRANASMKDHFLDNWANLKSATQIAELFDNYEDVRMVNSKPMDRWGRNDKILTYSGVKEKENRSGKTSPRLRASVPESTRERTFEKRVIQRCIQRCYHCNMPGHIKAVCPKLIKNKTTETLNNIEGNENPDFLNSYTTKGSVNGHEIDILRDTGATIDLVCAKYVNPSFSGENVWVKQPLSP